MSSQSRIRDYFSKWDPMKFISEGATADEYDKEADEVVNRFKAEMSTEDTAHLVHKVFVEYMEIDPDGFVEDCRSRADDIKKILGAS